tara:strand:- start:4763 stop:5008 length:246 start_codon:yes stop_codon:yes gene_type:complete
MAKNKKKKATMRDVELVLSNLIHDVNTLYRETKGLGAALHNYITFKKDAKGFTSFVKEKFKDKEKEKNNEKERTSSGVSSK